MRVAEPPHRLLFFALSVQRLVRTKLVGSRIFGSAVGAVIPPNVGRRLAFYLREPVRVSLQTADDASISAVGRRVRRASEITIDVETPDLDDAGLERVLRACHPAARIVALNVSYVYSTSTAAPPLLLGDYDPSAVQRGLRACGGG